jgi:hypothetical protein
MEFRASKRGYESAIDPHLGSIIPRNDPEQITPGPCCEWNREETHAPSGSGGQLLHDVIAGTEPARDIDAYAPSEYRNWLVGLNDRSA